MGAESVYVKIRSVSMLDAFAEAQKDAEEEHGHEQGYSGHINSCTLMGDKTFQWRNSNNKTEYIKDLQENAYKREVWGICIQEPVISKLKIKTVVKRIPQKGPRVYETVYTAYDFMGETEVIKAQKTLALAIKEARIWTEKSDKRCSVYCEKRLMKGNLLCAEIEPKKDSKKKDGIYIFVGQAPC